MYKKLNVNDGVDKMLETLEKEGVFVISNYIDDDQTKKLSSDADILLDKSKSPYRFGKFYRGKNLTNHKKDSEIRKVFDVDWMRALSERYHPEKPYGKSVVITNEYIKTDNWERQAWLHFDHKNTLKFFIYLNDVESGCGELTVCPKSHKMGKTLRDKWTVNEYEKKRKLENSIPEIVTQYEITPIIESKGSLIVFDTDTFHKGGVLIGDKTRKIIRIHNK